MNTENQKEKVKQPKLRPPKKGDNKKYFTSSAHTNMHKKKKLTVN